ncbi:MAG: hypothetical protein LBT40_00245 [Deltaproteobacteria bacterium]|nr:hypothetical protein [Deltaproteobacteria bacterium]
MSVRDRQTMPGPAAFGTGRHFMPAAFGGGNGTSGLPPSGGGRHFRPAAFGRGRPCWPASFGTGRPSWPDAIGTGRA